MRKIKKVLSPLQLEHCHLFTIIGRTASLSGNINSLLADKAIPQGEYRELLTKALILLNQADNLTRQLKLKREYFE